MTIANIHIQQVLLRRGNTVTASAYTGPIGEVILDTDLHTLRVQDGVTAGGTSILATQAQIDTLTNAISTITGFDSNTVTEISNILGGNVSFGNLIPRANVTYNLGSPEFQWGNLYVSSDTIYIAGIPLRVDTGGNLTINGNSVGGAGGNGSQLFNGAFTATLDSEGHLIANQFIAAQGTDNETGYSFHGDGGYDTGMFSNADGQLEFHNNAQQSATVDNDANWAFNKPVNISNLYNLNGVTIQNASLVNGATAALVLPVNGTTNSVELNNTYGSIAIQAGTDSDLTASWSFNADGKLTVPQNTGVDINWTSDTAGQGPGDLHYDSLRINNDHLHGLYITNTMDGTPSTWMFSKDGSFTLPSGYSIGGSDPAKGISLTTDRGTVLFGNHPEPGAPSHFHIMKDNPGSVDLIFGDDSNYVKLPGLDGSSHTYGVEIASQDISGENPQFKWRFETDGKLSLPDNGDSNGPSVIQVHNGYPTMMAYGSGGHGGPEWDWSDADTPYTFDNTSIRHAAYLNNQDGFFIGMNETHKANVWSGSWSFGTDGKLYFPDGTSQTTAYNPININLDGGGAASVYEIETAYADGGFASSRGFNETYDGSNGNNYILDGGRA